ncbi:hypothetical protein F4779DRAFT_613973 [Xylariaceae sp. FL0662B]|nr:hypothetical protein F4779DRAFT_613973 [Xylariaceae sp. FL0662B]
MANPAVASLIIDTPSRPLRISFPNIRLETLADTRLLCLIPPWRSSNDTNTNTDRNTTSSTTTHPNAPSAHSPSLSTPRRRRGRASPFQLRDDLLGPEMHAVTNQLSDLLIDPAHDSCLLRQFTAHVAALFGDPAAPRPTDGLMSIAHTRERIRRANHSAGVFSPIRTAFRAAESQQPQADDEVPSPLCASFERTCVCLALEREFVAQATACVPEMQTYAQRWGAAMRRDRLRPPRPPPPLNARLRRRMFDLLVLELAMVVGLHRLWDAEAVRVDGC